MFNRVENPIKMLSRLNCPEGNNNDDIHLMNEAALV